MAYMHGSLVALVAASLVVAPACGSSPDNNVSASQTDGSTTAQTTSTTSTTDDGATATTTGTTDGSGTDGMTSAPATTGEPPTSTTSTSSATSDSTTTTSTSGTTEPVDETTSSSTTGPECQPAPETCNKLDDDCDGVVDNVDEGGDGICDCLSIALFGNEGWIPSAEFQAYLEAQGTSVERISLDNTPITKAILDKYDIIILDWLVRDYSAEEAALIKAWVETGGGLMGMTGHANDDAIVARANSILQPLGLTYNTSQGYFDGPVTNWAVHPISKDVMSVSFKGGLFVDMVDDGVGMNTVVATLLPGPVGVAQTRLDGKVFAFGDEWIEFDSEWQQMAQIKQLWVNILGWLSPQDFCTIPQ